VGDAAGGICDERVVVLLVVVETGKIGARAPRKREIELRKPASSSNTAMRKR
jgi:hypothetical protein